MKGWTDCDFSTRYCFLRMMGRHRNLVSKLVLHEISEEGSIDWLDHIFCGGREDGDRIAFDETFYARLGLDKILEDSLLKEYMTSSNHGLMGPSWDAIGKTNRGTIILMNAVSEPEELYSKKYPEPKTRELSRKCFNEFGQFLGVEPNGAWTDYYSSYVTEIYFVWLLTQYGIPARHVTFCITPRNDRFSSHLFCFHVAFSERDSQLGPAITKYAKEHSSICCLSSGGESVYNFSPDGKAIYKDWYTKMVLQSVVLIS